MPKPFITIDYIKEQGFRIPDSSVDLVTEQLEQLIERAEEQYFQNTIGYGLTDLLYALVDPLPPEVEIFLNGNLVDGPEYYAGILPEITNFIMAQYYGGNDLNVNNSGLSTAQSDGERMIAANFIVNTLINKSRAMRAYTFSWLSDNNSDFFDTWEDDMFKCLKATSVW